MLLTGSLISGLLWVSGFTFVYLLSRYIKSLQTVVLIVWPLYKGETQVSYERHSDELELTAGQHNNES